MSEETIEETIEELSPRQAYVRERVLELLKPEVWETVEEPERQNGEDPTRGLTMWTFFDHGGMHYRYDNQDSHLEASTRAQMERGDTCVVDAKTTALFQEAFLARFSHLVSDDAWIAECEAARTR